MHHKHQRWLNMENAQLQAALSFWVSKRDEAKSNLDIFLNKPNGNFENPQQQINYLLKDFSSEFKVIYNERTMGLFIKSLDRLVQIKRSTVNLIHAFLH